MGSVRQKLGKSFLATGLVLLTGLTLTSCMQRIFNQPPVAIISIAEGVPYGTAPQTFVFDLSKSYDPDGEIVSFTIDFGDDSDPIEGVDINEDISHLYEQAGFYLVKLTVTDDYGKNDELTFAFGLYEPTIDE
jgi:PKD repeat protein